MKALLEGTSIRAWETHGLTWGASTLNVIDSGGQKLEEGDTMRNGNGWTCWMHSMHGMN